MHLPNQGEHASEGIEERLLRIDCAQLTAVDLMLDLTDTIASSHEVERAIFNVGICALHYRDALRELRELVASHD
jgi:hypothetical protein